MFGYSLGVTMKHYRKDVLKVMLFVLAVGVVAFAIAFAFGCSPVPHNEQGQIVSSYEPQSGYHNLGTLCAPGPEVVMK